MNAIRPDLPPVPSQGPALAIKTAQAAFFRAALAEVQAARPGPPHGAPPADTATMTESVRLPRPGALLDIRV